MTESSETLTIPIEGMRCGHCTATVQAALEAVPGVRSARVDLAEDRAELTVEPGKGDRSTLARAIEAAGYRVPGGPPKLVTIGPLPPPTLTSPEAPKPVVTIAPPRLAPPPAPAGPASEE